MTRGVKWLTSFVVLAAALTAVTPASAHLAYKARNDSQAERLRVQTLNLAHARYVCRHGGGVHERWSCKAISWLDRERAETYAALHPAPAVSSWVARQIAAAEVLGRESAGDPWPNCPDPYDGSGASWSSTVACENGGNWYDSPGYYRCGLQFDPMWERRFGRLCP